MPRDPDASSSDVQRARALSRRLAGDSAAPAAATRAEAGYIRFDAARLGAAPAATAVPAASAPPLHVPSPPRAVPAPPDGAAEWASLLGWVRALAGADAVFLSDARGLLVALAGELTHEHAEAMGARLVLAFEHADRMEAAAEASRFLVVDFGGSVLTGLRVALPEGDALVLGVAGTTALDSAARADIERALVAKASRD